MIRVIVTLNNSLYYKNKIKKMNLIPAKMLKAYRTGDIAISASWANLSASRIIDAKLIGAKFEDVESNLSIELLDRESADVVI